jgi:3'-phosphoadenosine 5'-phosphosulfate sulfotransferase (PAPS reductase)/FAD synthetase
MQHYPLSVKIGRTSAKILEYTIRLDGKIYVSYSAGKDSTVLADLTARTYKLLRGQGATHERELTLVFCDTGLEYPEIRAFAPKFAEWLRNAYDLPVRLETIRPKMAFAQVIAEFGYPVVGKELSRAIYYARRGSEWAIQKTKGNFKDGTRAERYQRYIKYKYLLDAPFPVSHACCEEMKIKPFRNFEKLSGLHPITGTTTEESYLRQSAWMKKGCNSFGGNRPVSNPMSFWTERDVLRYLLLTGIPYASVYGEITEKNGKLATTGCRRTGCFACMYGIQNEPEPNRYQRLKLTHPKLHAYCTDTLGCGAVLDFMNVKYQIGGLPMSAYTENGYKDRGDYLKSLAEEYDIPLRDVAVIADTLGPSEDFNGLVSEIEDYAMEQGQ